MTARQEKFGRPAGWLYWPLAVLAWAFFALVFGARFHRDPAIRKIKGPVMVIGNHPSYFDPFLMAVTIFPRRINMLASHGFFRYPFIRGVLKKLHVIPKTQFRTDSQALKKMFQVIRSDGTLGIYPEGQRSTDGSRQPVDEAIAKLVRKAGCTVILVKEEGGYLTWPRWSQSRWRHGRIDLRSSILFTPQQLEQLEIPAIQERIEAALDFREYQWQRQHRHLFLSRAPAKGLHVLCHQCPACNRDLAMQSGKQDMTCRFCGNHVRMDRYGFLEPVGNARAWADPYEWHRWQLADMARRLNQPDFHMEFAATAQIMEDSLDARPAGRGLITLDSTHLRFDSDPDASNPAPLHLAIPMHNKHGISADYGLQFEIVLAEGNFRFILDDGQAVVLIADAMAAQKSLDNHHPSNK